MTFLSSARSVIARLGAITLALAAVVTLVADVVLQPGYITGTLQLQGVTLTQAFVYATAGNSSSQVSTTSGSYQLTVNVPQGGSQQYVLQAYLYSDQSRDYLQLPSRTVTVSDGATSVENIAVTPGFVQGTIAVNGGSATGGSVYAQTSGAYANTSLVTPYTTFHFPAYPGTTSVGGNVTVNGVSVQLPVQQVTVTAGQTTTVNFTVTPALNTGVVTGLLQFSGGSTPFRVDVAASGPVSRSVMLAQAGAFNLAALADGGYSMYAYAYFGTTQRYLYLPNGAFNPSRSLTISGGNTVQRDVTVAASAVTGSIAVTGPRTLSSVSSAQMYADGLSPSAATSGFAVAPVSLPSGAFDLALSNGTWRPRSYLQFLDSNPQSYLNSTMDVYDLRPSATLSINGPTTLPIITYDAGTVSVVMAVPAPLTFSNPNVSGSCYDRDANNVLLRQFYVNASRSVSNVSTATVTFVGLKGVCDLQARVTINGGSVGIGQVQTAVVPGVEQNVDIGGPTLTMTAPVPNEVTTATSITVTGKATDDAQVQSVTVNNAAVALTSTNNPLDPREVSFSTTVNLPALGAHTITTRATDIAGKVTTDTRTVYRKAQPLVSWAAPAAIPVGAALGAAQLNATASVNGQPIPGSFAYTPSAGAVLGAGQDQVLSVTFTPADQTRYLTAQGSVTIDVLSSQPTIVWPAPASIGYGTALGAAQLNATAETSGVPIPGTFAYTPAAGAVLAAGTHQLSVTFTPTDSSTYQGATGSVSLTVSPATLVIGVGGASKAYGAPNPDFELVFSGFIDGDTAAVVTGTPTFTTSADVNSPVGNYEVMPGGLTAPNYTLSFISGMLSVTKAPLAITANHAGRSYGADNPAFTGVVTGLVAADGITVTYGSSADASSPVGTYDIDPVLADPNNRLGNYNVTLTPGTLTVGQRALTVTANDATRTYGASTLGFTVSYQGFVAGDGPGDLGGTLAFGGTAPAAVNVGSYTIVPSGLSSNNYTVQFAAGTLTVTTAGLSIRADSKGMLLNGGLPAFTATYDGLVNGDTPASLDTPATLGTAATGNAVGTFAITAGGAADQNYAIGYQPGTLTVSYSTGACLGDLGRAVLQPVNVDGTSVFKQKSTVPIKFRVCDANGVSVATSVVSSFLLVQRITGTAAQDVNEAPVSTTPDTTFRWDPTAQQWIFNLNTKSLQAGVTYRYQIGLADGGSIPFQFGLR